MNTKIERVTANPKFQELVHTRGRYAWGLSILVLAVFYGFVLLVAFDPDLMGTAIAEGSMWTIGYVGGLLIFIGSWLLMLMFVRRANDEFDGMNKEIVRDAMMGDKA